MIYRYQYNILMDAHIYNGYSIEAGTTPECYRALQIFMKGFHVGVNLTINGEVA